MRPAEGTVPGAPDVDPSHDQPKRTRTSLTSGATCTARSKRPGISIASSTRGDVRRPAPRHRRGARARVAPDDRDLHRGDWRGRRRAREPGVGVGSHGYEEETRNGGITQRGSRAAGEGDRSGRPRCARAPGRGDCRRDAAHAASASGAPHAGELVARREDRWSVRLRRRGPGRVVDPKRGRAAPRRGLAQVADRCALPWSRGGPCPNRKAGERGAQVADRCGAPLVARGSVPEPKGRGTRCAGRRSVRRSPSRAGARA